MSLPPTEVGLVSSVTEEVAFKYRKAIKEATLVMGLREIFRVSKVGKERQRPAILFAGVGRLRM